jgi:hypothetical protein
MFDKYMNQHCYDIILNFYTNSFSNNKENSIQINEFIINFSNNYLKLISRNEYRNCLILIQNLFLTDVPDHSFHRGKSRYLLNPNELIVFKEILFQELDSLL